MGGTRFVGKPLVARLQAQGHELTLFTRGKNPVPDGVTHLSGDRSTRRAQGPQGSFDVIVDSSGRSSMTAAGFGSRAPPDIASSTQLCGLPPEQFRSMKTAPPIPRPTRRQGRHRDLLRQKASPSPASARPTSTDRAITTRSSAGSSTGSCTTARCRCPAMAARSRSWGTWMTWLRRWARLMWKWPPTASTTARQTGHHVQGPDQPPACGRDPDSVDMRSLIPPVWTPRPVKPSPCA